MRVRPSFYTFLAKYSMIVLVFLALVKIASAATYSTGGGKKKEAAKKTTLTTLNLKNNSLSFHNGYRYKGGLSFSKNGATGISLNINTLYYQKGNNIYVIPHKQKAFFTKFKTPQKELN